MGPRRTIKIIPRCRWVVVSRFPKKRFIQIHPGSRTPSMTIVVGGSGFNLPKLNLWLRFFLIMLLSLRQSHPGNEMRIHGKPSHGHPPPPPTLTHAGLIRHIDESVMVTVFWFLFCVHFYRVKWQDRWDCTSGEFNHLPTGRLFWLQIFFNPEPFVIFSIHNWIFIALVISTIHSLETVTYVVLV